ncbi:MAG: hypothetical protein ACOY3Z_11690 [Thermodesulfobacteriota bacterium]
MCKKMIFLAVAMMFVAGGATAAMAVDCNGEAKAVQGNTVTVLCENGAETKAEVTSGTVAVGDKVAVKGGKIAAVKVEKPTKKKIEGC